MRHKKTAIVGGLALVGTFLVSIASATIWSWPEKKRPPIDLSTAYSMALRHLGNDSRDYYCTGVSIVGNAAQDGKEGAWWLHFNTEDGKKLTVYIHMDGRIGNTRDNK